LRLFSFGGYGLALAALALVVFGAIECSPFFPFFVAKLGEVTGKGRGMRKTLVNGRPAEW